MGLCGGGEGRGGGWLGCVFSGLCGVFFCLLWVGVVGGGSSEAEGLVRRKPRGLVFCCFWACLSGGCLLFLQCVSWVWVLLFFEFFAAFSRRSIAVDRNGIRVCYRGA